MKMEWGSKEEVFLIVTNVTVADTIENAEIVAVAVAEQRGHATVIKVPANWDADALTYEDRGVISYAGDSKEGRAARDRGWEGAL